VSSVLGTVSVVTILSYNFSTGEKQRGSLLKSFVEQHMKMSHQEVFFVSSFQLSDNFNPEIRILQAGGRTFNGEIFFDSSGVAQQIFIIISIFIQFFPFQIPNLQSIFCSQQQCQYGFQSWMEDITVAVRFRSHFQIQNS